MKSKIIANVALIAAIGGGAAATAETAYQYAKITHQEVYANECLAHLSNKTQLKQKDLPLGCDKVESDLIITLRKRAGLLIGDYTLPSRQAFETEQQSFDEQRKQIYGTNVLKFTGAGTLIMGLGWALLEGALWQNHRKYTPNTLPKVKQNST